jgi:hypothetical protein
MNEGFLRTVIGKHIYWEEKRDGSNISIFYRDGFMMVHTRNQMANDHVQGEVKGLVKDFEPQLRQMLGERYIVYMELLRMGKSPAQFEVNDEPSILAFDLWDTEEQRFVEPYAKYLVFAKFGIPYIPAVMVTGHDDVQNFRDIVGVMIELAKNRGLEGFVPKWTYKEEQLKLKVKVEHSYPKAPSKKGNKKSDSRIPLEYSEVTGAIDKVFMEIGNDIFDKTIAMPLIAKAVGEECRKHKATNPHNIFIAYLGFIEALEKPTTE